MTEKMGWRKWLTPLMIVGVLASLLLVLVIVLSILYGIERNKNSPEEENEEFCLSSACIKAGLYEFNGRYP